MNNTRNAYLEAIEINWNGARYPDSRHVRFDFSGLGLINLVGTRCFECLTNSPLT